MPDVFALLAADHQKVRETLARLGEEGLDADERGHLAEKLVMAESAHEAAEETYFWPAVGERLPDGADLVSAGTAQEAQVKEILEAWGDQDPGGTDFARSLALFGAAANAHIVFEEEKVWPALRKVLSAAEAEDLGSKVGDAIDNGPTRPHSHGPASPAGLKTVGLAQATVDKLRDAWSGRGE